MIDASSYKHTETFDFPGMTAEEATKAVLEARKIEPTWDMLYLEVTAEGTKATLLFRNAELHERFKVNPKTFEAISKHGRRVAA